MGHDSIPAILSYVLSFYTLTVWCIQLPRLIPMFRKFREENKYARRFLEDRELRMKVSLYGTLYFNTAYALLQLGLGFWHHTFWYYTLAGYYICLAVMRFFLARYTSSHKPGENQKEELLRYRNCGIVLLLMNLTLSVMVFFMIYWGRTFHHHEITTIALAAYTFTAFTFAVINLIKYRKLKSPVYSAAKVVSLASACVSMLTLEAAMLTAFGDETMNDLTRKLFLGLTGFAVCAFIILMAINMIHYGNDRLRRIANARQRKF
jgi:MFS family permease